MTDQYFVCGAVIIKIDQIKAAHVEKIGKARYLVVYLDGWELKYDSDMLGKIDVADAHKLLYHAIGAFR